MMYDPELIRPMREELTSAGIQELLTAADVDRWVADQAPGMLVVNSVCGCAAGAARPAVRLALQHGTRPARVATVFAGQDKEATARARQHFAHLPPSSPSIFLFKGGKVVDSIPRLRIEGRSATEIGTDLRNMFDQHFGAK